MTCLIDTQSFLWYIEDKPLLPKRIKEMMNDKTNTLYLSIASLWEITIKMSIGKLVLSKTLPELIQEVSVHGFKLLGIEPSHLLALAQLEMHHRDPFDRIIMSQAIAEDIDLVSSDAEFKKYPVKLLWR
jgi:PIN domain nuclease of toxin-antitoxin system